MAIKGVRTTVNDDLPGPSNLGGEFSGAKGEKGASAATAKDIPVAQIKEKGRAPKAMAYPTKGGTSIRPPYEGKFKQSQDRV